MADTINDEENPDSEEMKSRAMREEAALMEQSIGETQHVTLPRMYRTNRRTCQKIKMAIGSKTVCPKIIPPLISNDSINTEFLYYLGTIRELLPALTIYGNRLKVLPWLKKLLAPEYQAKRLRLKRNKCMYHLILIMVSDTISGIFWDPPTTVKLPDVTRLEPPSNLPLPRWETDKYWDDLVKDLSPEEGVLRCSTHVDCGENEDDEGNFHTVAGALLDQEFRFFLYLARPLVPMVANVRQRAMFAIWILTLAKVRTCACIIMKAIRNDYMQAILGYLQELRLVGPFHKMPPENGATIIPLAEFADKRNPFSFLTRSVTSPASAEADDFMQEQPIPGTGAFCYIAVTGNVEEPKKISNVPLDNSVDTTKFDKYLAV